MFSLLNATVFLVFLISTVTSGIIRDRRAIEDYWYSNGVVNNVVSDNMVGGPTSLAESGSVPDRPDDSNASGSSVSKRKSLR
uniref:Secreted protein n=1 Tax=Caenorhabditis tropicalis TaxID=1561998 RepID=A0A1I7TK24_9PELO